MHSKRKSSKSSIGDKFTRLIHNLRRNLHPSFAHKEQTNHPTDQHVYDENDDFDQPVPNRECYPV